MIVILKREASPQDLETIVEKLRSFGFNPHIIRGEERTVIGAVGNGDKERVKALITCTFVDNVVPVMKPYKLASRTTKREDTIVDVEGVKIGGPYFVVIAGPCSVETEPQILSSARAAKRAGAAMLRGGAYKPRTSPYAFQGLEEEGLGLLQKAKAETGLKIVTEVMAPMQMELVSRHTDIVQVGARNMQNFSLLKEVGKQPKPVLLKRGMSATLEELLMSAEYIMSEGNYDVILCERGIRTFETAYRNSLDLNAVPALQALTHLPVVVDPSHGTGRRDLIIPMAKAAIAAGASGLAIEIHPNPEEAWSDGPQSLTFEEFDRLMAEIKPYIELAGKKLQILK